MSLPMEILIQESTRKDVQTAGESILGITKQLMLENGRMV